MLEIDSLIFGYLDEPILNGLNLSVQKGEIVSIIGPSGSGKTTLFQLIAGLYSPQQGSIQKAEFAYMMQEDLLLPWKSVLNNLLFMLELQRLDNKATRLKKALEVLNEVGLQGFEYYYPRALSGGMKQRASLARTLLLQKPLLLLDEPFGAVDAVRRQALYALLKTLHKRYDLTIVFITHDLHDALQLSHTVYFLEEKKLKKCSKEELMKVLYAP
jgi:ABC-type nitrate/sulfonate/bicarbonate transport system ATPase subunit